MTNTKGEYANVLKEGRLYPREQNWLHLQPWLKSCGYTLRDRYQPNWEALRGRTRSRFYPSIGCVERGWFPCDAQNISISRHPSEIEMGQLFSSEPLASNPKNSCVPLHDVLRVPDDEDRAILVMPLLYQIENPPFQTIGEVVEFFRQIFEGLQLMHHQRIAHRDCKYNNIMADVLPLYTFPHPFNLWMKRDFSGDVKICSTRTHTPIKYYLVDFGLSRCYDPKDGPPLELPPWGGDKSVPEFVTVDTPCDPFAVDAYCLGNVIRQYFLEGIPRFPPRKGLGFMKDIVADMVNKDPKQRPTMDEVVTRFNDFTRRLGTWKLRSRLGSKKEGVLKGVARSVVHWTRQIEPVVKRIPPIPRVPPAKKYHP